MRGNTMTQIAGCPNGYGITTNQIGPQDIPVIFGICNVINLNDNKGAFKYTCNQNQDGVDAEYFTDIHCQNSSQLFPKMNMTADFKQFVCSSDDSDYDSSCGYVEMYEWTPTAQDGTCGNYDDVASTNKTLKTVVYDSWSYPINSCIENPYSAMEGMNTLYEKNTLISCDANKAGTVIKSNVYTDNTCSSEEEAFNLTTQGEHDVSVEYKCRKNPQSIEFLPQVNGGAGRPKGH